jgi:hypothetical protein
MAKIIGHYFDGVSKYSTFSLDELRETGALYIRTHDTINNALDVFDNWEALNKNHLGLLRPLKSGGYTMYLLHEDLPRFKEKVEVALSFWQNIRIITPQSVGRELYDCKN